MPIEFTINKRMHEIEMHEKTVIFTQENSRKNHFVATFVVRHFSFSNKNTNWVSLNTCHRGTKEF